MAKIPDTRPMYAYLADIQIHVGTDNEDHMKQLYIDYNKDSALAKAKADAAIYDSKAIVTITDCETENGDCEIVAKTLGLDDCNDWIKIHDVIDLMPPCRIVIKKWHDTATIIQK